jgi:hypothetical protein
MENSIKTNMTVPFKACIIGDSCSLTKTNILLNLLSHMNNTFNTIHIYTHYRTMPFYAYLESKLGPTSLKIHEDLDNLKNIYKMDNNKIDLDYIGRTLIIFDGIFSEYDQYYISRFYSNHPKGISLCYLSSHLYHIIPFIRLQLQYIFFKKIIDRRTNKIILREYRLKANEEQILAMFKYCANDNDFLLIDTEKNIYIKGFTEIIDNI